MCKPGDRIKFCTCGVSPKPRNTLNKFIQKKRDLGSNTPTLGKNCWHLISRHNEIDIDGTLALPDQERNERLRREHAPLLSLLNDIDYKAFDFEYSPSNEDILEVNLEGLWARLVYAHDRWYVDIPGIGGLSQWDHWLVASGEVRRAEEE